MNVAPFEEEKLTPSDGAGEDHFGVAVAVSGDTAIVGAQSDDDVLFEDSGSAYVFAIPELSAIFIDGFESGTTSAWIVVDP